MTEINLLPWRVTLRNRVKREFLIVSVIIVALSIFIVTLSINIIQSKIQRQQAENVVLQSNVDRFKSKITTIKTIKIEMNNLVIKRTILEKSQSEGIAMVRLLEQVAYQTPPGVYLIRFDKKGQLLIFEGVAESNARVSEFMQKIAQSKWISGPQLMEIKVADDKEKSKGYYFKVTALCL